MTWFFMDSWLHDVAARQLELINTFSARDSFPKGDVLMGKEKGELVFKFALAGYSTDSVEVDFEDDILIVKGTRKEDTDGYEILEKGIKSSSFIRKYRVSDKFDTSKSNAEFKDGILTVTVPLHPDKGPKKIKLL